MVTTIKDIAKKLDISPSTVSRALNRKGGISENTIKAVQLMAKKLNYKPNSFAVGLRNHKTYCIGVVVPSISSYFFAQAISGIQEVASKANYQVLISQTDDLESKEKASLRMLSSGRVDGILLSMASEIPCMTYIKSILKELPTVLFDRTTDKVKAVQVEAEDFKGSFEAVRHLIKSGRKRILYLMGPRGLDISTSRFEGYKEALVKHNIEFDESLVACCGFDVSLVRPAIAELVTHNKPFDAIAAVNDELAVEAMATLDSFGIQVPSDVAVVGFGNYPIAEIVKPKLTTINHQAKNIGAESARRLIEQIEYQLPFTPKKYTIESQLIKRESA